MAAAVLLGIVASSAGQTPPPTSVPRPGVSASPSGPVLGVLGNRRPEHPAAAPAPAVKPVPSTNAQTTQAATLRLSRPTGAPIALSQRHVAAATKPKDQLTVENKSYPVRTYKALAMPNDPSANQWWVNDAKLPAAWDVPAGNNDTLLAIVDTGFGLKHEDLAGRWYASPGESGATLRENPSTLNCTDRGLPLDASCNLVDDNLDGIVDNESGSVSYENPSELNCTDQGKPLDKSCNRVDDDNNGYVDDVTGWDFADGDNSVQAGQIDPAGTGTVHGTRTAGIAAATGNNGKGIAGADWHTKILPIQALDDDSYGNTFTVGQGIMYAADHGANVISVSLGSDADDPYVEAAVQYAEAKGSLVVAAAGNDGCDCMLYPARYPEVLSVGALGTDGNRASYSSYGSRLDILAPGSSMTSTDWSASNQTSAYVSGINGTSFATPLVAGMLTRVLSQQPSAVPLQLLDAIKSTTNRMGLASAQARSDGLGYGKLDAYALTLRMTQAATIARLLAFTPASLGARLDPASPSEVASNYYAAWCASGRPGATDLYHLIKGQDYFYSISPSEISSGQKAGYAATQVGSVCLTQPQDTPQQVHPITLFNDFKKLL